MSAWRRVDWPAVFLLAILPALGFCSTPWVHLRLQTFIWSVLYGSMCIGSITVGYHRLWSHRSYSTNKYVKWALAVQGAGALQGPIRWWARKHRSHHRYTDTELDPYNVSQGFWHAHMAWMIFKQPNRNNHVDTSDLNNDPIVSWQRRYYIPLAALMAWVFPTLVAGLGWNDYTGGFLYAGILRMFFCHQSTFCINSLAHYVGDQPFDDRRSARDLWVTAIFTLGEGYHNFHHEFPSDYRNGIEWYHFDPSKWVIWILGASGLADNLKRFRQTEIEKGRIQQLRKNLECRARGLDWGRQINELPVLNWNEYQERVKNGESLLAVEGLIHDVTDFFDEHPGGRTLISSAVGKDATALFNGGIYEHSNAARNLLSIKRIAILRGGSEVEIQKRLTQLEPDNLSGEKIKCRK